MRHVLPLSLSILAMTTPGFAQEHDHHVRTPASDEQTVPPTGGGETSSQNGTGHTGTDHQEMDHSGMDHSGMDHSAVNDQTDHSSHGSSPQPVDIPEAAPPAEAFAGPAFAADAFVGAEKMAASRKAVVAEMSGMPVFWFQADRAEYRARSGNDGYLWDVQGYYGGDIDKFWFKSEGEGSFGEKPEAAEIQALWSHAVGPWWDFQAGVRHDLAGPDRTHAVVGVQGLAPYLFEIDAAVFLSQKGDLTASVEAELDQRITQRLILQPRAELSFSAQNIPELDIGAGLDKAELGLRLRYEFAREFAPYIGVEQEWRTGQSADYARAHGEHVSVTNLVVGVRFWF
tara:strand:+ start:5560 stop:6585 length:1026 start_codon:yes stop_codon:yes gene_type:complete